MLVDVVDGADIGMIEGGSRFSFSPEPLQGVMISGEFFRQELQGDKTMESGVLGLVDDTHATAAKLLNDLVVRNRLADHTGSNPSFRKEVQVGQTFAWRTADSSFETSTIDNHLVYLTGPK